MLSLCCVLVVLGRYRLVFRLLDGRGMSFARKKIRFVSIGRNSRIDRTCAAFRLSLIKAFIPAERSQTHTPQTLILGHDLPTVNFSTVLRFPTFTSTPPTYAAALLLLGIQVKISSGGKSLWTNIEKCMPRRLKLQIDLGEKRQPAD